MSRLAREVAQTLRRSHLIVGCYIRSIAFIWCCYDEVWQQLTQYLAQSEHASDEDADGDEELVARAERATQVERRDLSQVHGRETSRKT